MDLILVLHQELFGTESLTLLWNFCFGQVGRLLGGKEALSEK